MIWRHYMTICPWVLRNFYHKLSSNRKPSFAFMHSRLHCATNGTFIEKKKGRKKYSCNVTSILQSTPFRKTCHDKLVVTRTSYSFTVNGFLNRMVLSKYPPPSTSHGYQTWIKMNNSLYPNNMHDKKMEPQGMIKMRCFMCVPRELQTQGLKYVMVKTAVLSIVETKIWRGA